MPRTYLYCSLITYPLCYFIVNHLKTLPQIYQAIILSTIFLVFFVFTAVLIYGLYTGHQKNKIQAEPDQKRVDQQRFNKWANHVNALTYRQAPLGSGKTQLNIYDVDEKIVAKLIYMQTLLGSFKTSLVLAEGITPKDRLVFKNACFHSFHELLSWGEYMQKPASHQRKYFRLKNLFSGQYYPEF